MDRTKPIPGQTLPIFRSNLHLDLQPEDEGETLQVGPGRCRPPTPDLTIHNTHTHIYLFYSIHTYLLNSLNIKVYKKQAIFIMKMILI